MDDDQRGRHGQPTLQHVKVRLGNEANAHQDIAVTITYHSHNNHSTRADQPRTTASTRSQSRALRDHHHPQPVLITICGSHDDTVVTTSRRSPSVVDLTHQHKNHTVLVEGPEIMIRPVGTRRLVAGGAR